MPRKLLPAVLLIGMLTCIPLAAQSTDAALSGSVTDPSAAPVTGSIVTVLSLSTGVVSTTKTNASGVYLFPALPPGTYRLTAEHPGFRKAVVSEVELEVGAQRSINLPLELGATSESVEVHATSTDLGYSDASVGTVVNGRKILELPLAGRSAYDLLSTQAGVIRTGSNGIFLSGNRPGSINVTMDGINAQDNLLNGIFNFGVANNVSVDRAEEFRIITSPADAELGRGAGQIQMVTRAGGNTFHGALWDEHRNTILTANNWFNNQRGIDPVTGQQVSPRDILIRNQYGARLGGPIRHNRTFFNGLYEGDKQRSKVATTQTVYTNSARQGLFRFFPGALNANANAAIPTVDLQGNPVRPPTATDVLQSVSVFGRDPNRLVADPTGAVAKLLGLTPLPNNFRAGDGLNTAGFTWSRPIKYDFELYETRVDHLFNDKERVAVTFTHQAYHSFNVAGPQPFPASPGGVAPTETTQYSAALTSVFRPNLLNEFRAGVFRPRTEITAPYDPHAGGSSILPAAGGVAYIFGFSTNITSPLAATDFGSDNSNRISPVYQWGDNITWLKGRHTFKGGAEVRFVSSAGYDAFAVTPRAIVGSGFVPVQNINNITGIGGNSGGAGNMLLDLNGSLAQAFQVYNSPGGANPVFVSGQTRYRNWSQHEFDWFFKDDFKVTPSFTLNLGIRYEWYAVPHERQGKALAPVGGGAGVFGISGTGFGDLFHPGRLNGALTQIQLVGPGTPNPGVKLYDNDNNNFAPSIGFAWSLPWFGKNKTVIRAGYGIGYERNPIYLTHNVSGLEPGLSETDFLIPATLFNVGNLKLPVPQAGVPLAPVPLTSRTGTLTGFDQHLRTPYVQNFSFSIQRALAKNTTLDLRYIGSKGSKLVREASVNEVNIFENGLLDAFRIIQTGGTSPLMELIFGPGGSNLARTNTSINGFFNNNNVGGFASALNSTNLITGVNGGLLKRAGLADNFVVANPQFANAYLTGNFANSTYHSVQGELTKRFSSGFTFQGNYTFSKALGEEEGDGTSLTSNYRTLRNLGLDKRRLGFDRRHVWKANGIWELPFGPGKTFGRNTHGVVGRLIGGWQTGAIFNRFSGQPISFGAVNAYNTFGGFTPVAASAVSTGLGGVEKTGNSVIYFGNLRQIPDPYIALITTLGGIQGRSTLRAITDASGNLLMVNPAPGQFGNIGQNNIEGPGTFRLDVNVIKRVSITERIELQLRADAINLTNTPQFANPNTDINSTNFGRITTTATGTSPRLVVLQMRVSF